MLTHTHDDLELVHARGRRLRADAAAARVGGRSPVRHAIAVALRRAADRLDPARLAPTPDLLVKER